MLLPTSEWGKRPPKGYATAARGREIVVFSGRVMSSWSKGKHKTWLFFILIFTPGFFFLLPFISFFLSIELAKWICRAGFDTKHIQEKKNREFMEISKHAIHVLVQEKKKGFKSEPTSLLSN